MGRRDGKVRKFRIASGERVYPVVHDQKDHAADDCKERIHKGRTNPAG
jgi:hypothetical protein